MTTSFTDVTATRGTDYTGNAAALSFSGAAGETQTLTVATLEERDRDRTKVEQMMRPDAMLRRIVDLELRIEDLEQRCAEDRARCDQ